MDCGWLFKSSLKVCTKSPRAFLMLSEALYHTRCGTRSAYLHETRKGNAHDKGTPEMGARGKVRIVFTFHCLIKRAAFDHLLSVLHRYCSNPKLRCHPAPDDAAPLLLSSTLHERPASQLPPCAIAYLEAILPVANREERSLCVWSVVTAFPNPCGR
jgi:hypothetical protein